MSKLPDYGLTIRDPGARAIIWGPKRVENRTWQPPEKVIGERLAIGMSKTIDEETNEALRDRISDQTKKHDVAAMTAYRHHPGHIIGSVRVVGFLDERVDEPVARHQEEGPQECSSMWPSEVVDNNWYVGPVGWILFDPRPLDDPVPVRGMPGVWNVERQIRGAQE